MQYLEKQNLQYPEIRQQRNRIEAEIARQSLVPGAAYKGSAIVYTIPVVVHVIYNNGVQNISDGQIISQIDAMNRDFQLKNADTNLIPAAFKSLKADLQIQFCLAQRDPSNAVTTGITRTSTSVTSFIDDDKMKFNATGGRDAWPRNKYLNLWVCNMPSLLGYAQFPGGPANTDGVVIHYPAFGTTGTATAPYNLGRTGTHEVGHWLGLLHTFEGGCTGNGDFVTDTPPQTVENYGCPAFPHFSCSGTSNGDMFMNFMDYVNDNCMLMFSAGQRIRANLVIGSYTSLDSVTKSQGCVPVPPINNDAVAATTVTPGAGCTGAPFTNAGATQSAGEPFPSCAAASGTHTVWFKFTAPASGAVRISTDAGAGNTLSDTYLALFSATNAGNYATFQSIACDDNGGSAIGNNLSVLYATGLTSGTTYYVAVDGYNGATGTFCISVDALSNSMLSSADCSSTYQVPSGSNTYTGWVPLLDNNSQLVAMVRNPSGSSASGYTPGQYIHSGLVRSGLNGKYYMNRNYLINNPAASNVNVRLFFPTADLTAMTTVSPTTTLSSLSIARQTGSTCSGDYNAANGTTTILTQTGSGSSNGVSWVDFTTPGFSNFFIIGGSSTALPVTIESISAKNFGSHNIIDWKVYSETSGVLYKVERSADGKDYTALTTMTGGAKDGLYTFTDLYPLEGINYYRINVAETNGEKHYSNTVSTIVKAGNMIHMQAIPNPVSGILNITIGGFIEKDATIMLSDVNGKIKMIEQVNSNKMSLNVHALPAGIYILKYMDAKRKEVLRINKL